MEGIVHSPLAFRVLLQPFHQRLRIFFAFLFRFRSFCRRRSLRCRLWLFRRLGNVGLGALWRLRRFAALPHCGQSRHSMAETADQRSRQRRSARIASKLLLRTLRSSSCRS
eukprot:scaffold228_cov312-Pinguiococcus_pyrenoidosus.AAC.20